MLRLSASGRRRDLSRRTRAGDRLAALVRVDRDPGEPGAVKRGSGRLAVLGLVHVDRDLVVARPAERPPPPPSRSAKQRRQEPHRLLPDVLPMVLGGDEGASEPANRHDRHDEGSYSIRRAWSARPIRARFRTLRSRDSDAGRPSRRLGCGRARRTSGSRRRPRPEGTRTASSPTPDPPFPPRREAGSPSEDPARSARTP